jgi:dATP/dGTP diphosphohydrolase
MNISNRLMASPALTGDISPVKKAVRDPIKERYDALLPEFLEAMALIGGHAVEKYKKWDNYMLSRLEGDQSPVNHIMKHLTEFRANRPYDKFDGSRRWHLVAIAYNAMMEFWYEQNMPESEETKS